MKLAGKTVLVFAAALVAALVLDGPVTGQNPKVAVSGGATGIFSSFTAGADNPKPKTYGKGTHDFRFGKPVPGEVPNRLHFQGYKFRAVPGKKFKVGKLCYRNSPTVVGTSVDSVNMQVTFTFTSPAALAKGKPVVFNFNMPITTTTNVKNPQKSSDDITLPATLPAQTFNYGGVPYTLQLTDFTLVSPAPRDGYIDKKNPLKLHVYEGKQVCVFVWGKLTIAPEPSSVAELAIGAALLALLVIRAKRHVIIGS